MADDAQNDYQNAKNDNSASLGHEVIAGGASFFAMHEFEKHQRSKGVSSTSTTSLPFRVAVRYLLL